jgi:tetratricopeptide (TPR) repeat protein
MKAVALLLTLMVGSSAVLSSSAVALQARDLIQEAEDVLKILGPKDPERQPVALRLADLLFDAAIEIDADAKTTAEGNRRADQYRLRSETLYKEALPTLKEARAQRVKFQLARLYSFRAQMPAAIKLWKDIFESPGDSKLRRESALHWAEQLELANDIPSIREAAALYRKALPLADKDSLRSYIMYRTAWTEYRLGGAAGAAVMLQKSIELADDKERDDLLRDLVLFLSRDIQPAKTQIALIEKLEDKYKRQGFLAQLSDAYLAADRRMDYSVALEHLNRRQPNLERSVGILDASHDSLTVPQIHKHLDKLLELKRSGGTFKDDTIAKSSRDKLFRLVHLWDGHRRSNKEGYNELLAKGVSTMILLYPKAEESTQAMGGWLAANNDIKVQLPMVDKWIGLAQETGNTKMEISLTKTKLELVRQAKDWDSVVEVSARLETITSEQTRPVRYQRAKALYELKKYDQALPLFLAMGEIANSAGDKDDLQRLSQDLALDILAIQKDFPKIVALTGKWKGDHARNEEMRGLNEKASFEGAVASQDTGALSTFTQFCLEKKFTPKSCDNARSLAGKLRNQGTLLTVLKAQGDDKELMRQLEVAGRFGESARMMEKTLKGSEDKMAWLKVALLYELQGELPERNRVLNHLVRTLARAKLTDQEQNLIYLTLKDAGLIEERLLSLAWSKPMHLRLVNELYEQKNSKAAEAILAKSCEGGGPGWQSLHLKVMKDTHAKQAKINKFTGSTSKRRFEERVAVLKTLGQQTNCFKQGAPDEMARAASEKVAAAYAEFAGQIRNTPIPDGLDEETLAEVNAQIEAMSSPFEKQSATWREEANKIAVAVPLPESWSYDLPAKAAAIKPVAFDWQPLIKDIQKEPFERSHFEHLKAHFETKGRPRLAGYVKGRLEDLQ